MDRDAVAGVADELGRRTAALPGMKLQAASVWLAIQAVDMRTGLMGYLCMCSRRWAAHPATAERMCPATAEGPA